jgi:hypothetical protein
MELKDEWILYLKTLKEGRKLREDGFGSKATKLILAGNRRWTSAIYATYGWISIEWDIREGTILDCYLSTGEVFKGDALEPT